MIGKKIIVFIVAVCLFGFFLMGDVSAIATSFSQSSTNFGSSAGSASFVTYGNPGGFSQFYTTGDLNTYWPILGNKEECQSRKDLMLQVAPGGCQPIVVRSDLLEEQDVPVFCQLQSLKLNPAIDVKEIQNIRFSAAEKYPAAVLGTGFHPANAALRTTNSLTGSPLSNNIGYVVVILKKTPNESAMPENVKVNLLAQVQFDASNTLGVGRAEFSLTPTTDSQWELDKIKNSFWNGRYSIRLEEAGADYAVVSIYQGVQKVTTQRVALGKTSEDIYLPGLYCRAGLQVNYDGLVSAQKKARIEVTDDNGKDIYDVYAGSKFLDDKCSVNSINVNPLDGTGSLLAYCGSETLNLKINPKLLTTGDMIPAQNIDWSDDPNYLVPGPLRRAGFGATAVGAVSDKVSGTTSVCEVHLKYPFISQDREGYYSIQRANESTSSSDWKLYKRAAIGTMNGDSQEENMKKDENLWMGVLKQELITKCEQRMKKSTTTAGVGASTDNQGVSDSIVEKIYPDPAETNIKSAVDSFKQLATDYPQEGDAGKDSKYAQDGLQEAIKFTGDLNKSRTQAGLIDIFSSTYPSSQLNESYAIAKAKLNNVDSSGASKTITVNNRAVTVKLISTENPKEEQASAEFSWGGKTFKVGVDGMQEVDMRMGGKARIVLKELMSGEQVRVSIICPKDWDSLLKTEMGKNPTLKDTASATQSFLERMWRSTDTASSLGFKLLSLKQPQDQCGESLSLENVNLAKVAKIRLIPNAKQMQEEINLSVSIGIEKRAISLTPQETASRIDKLNETLKKLDSLNENLKTMVSGLKAACFATSGLLTAKTFLTGLSGEGLARQQVMKGNGGWDQKCQDLVGQKQYTTVSQCYSDKASEINADVAAYASGINAANSKLKQIEDSSMIKAGLTGGEVVDRNASATKLIAALRSEYPESQIKLKDGTTRKVSDLLDEKSYSRNDVSYEELRDLYTGLSIKGESTTGQAAVDSNLKTIADDINERKKWSVVRENLANSEFSNSLGLKDKPVDSYGNSKSTNGNYYGGSTTPDQLTKKLQDSNLKTDDVSKLTKNGQIPTQEITFDNKPYLLVLGATSSTGQYTTKKIYSIDTTSGTEPKLKDDVTSTDEGKKVLERITVYNKLDATSYSNKMENPEVKYYEIDPYKGMPAQVPIDVQKGWYVATKNTLGTTGNIKAFESNGKPSSFWLCNVGYNGRIEFFSGMGDDVCRQFNLDTGATLDTFPGLSTTETTSLVRKATQALTEAADKYQAGIKSVSVLGQRYNVGSPAVKNGGTQCQDFMDPNDCKLLFNVCDPVICPSSRCDFGGKYPVTDVIQSGIVGSTLLCLPNFPEVKIPICISGIQAGIDSFISVLRSYRDCLQESLNSGKTVGICDEMNSIYMCEFFWKQAAPLMNTLIPKAFEMALTGGQGTKGGGEYLTVQGAWDNAKKSMDYFTQSYAVNSIKAFQVRSTEDLGTEVCKGFVSLTTPNSLKNLIEPDSPPQFYARFDAVKYSDATVPATSQYKVYYQIYAGQDSGVYYNVYLKGAPTTSYYYSNPTVQVDSGFITKGQSASQTRDFTAPEGYKQLCVRINDQEQCGFNSVTSDFALNNIKDSYVADQITQSNIQTEQGCISGTVVPTSITGIVATGATLDAVGNGIYNYGVTRVCSTANPGSTTDVTRFVDVGFCGDTKIRCWLDSRSVNAAIGASNVGLKNQTLADLSNLAVANLEASGQYYSKDQAGSELNKINDALATLKNKFDASAASTLLNNINTLWSKLYINQHKAKLLLYKAQTQEEIAKDSAKGVLAQQDYVSSTKVPKLVNNILKLSETYDPDKEISILAPDGGKIAYLKGGEVFGPAGFKIGNIYTSSDYEAMTASVIDVAGIYRIQLIGTAKDYIPDKYAQYIHYLDGSVIKEGNMYVDENSYALASAPVPKAETGGNAPVATELYSFSLDKKYSATAGNVSILDDIDVSRIRKSLNYVASWFTKNPNYIGIYINGINLYTESGLEVGSLSLIDNQGSAAYKITTVGGPDETTGETYYSTVNEATDADVADPVVMQFVKMKEGAIGKYYNPESVGDLAIESYLNALDGLVIVDNKLYRSQDIPKKPVTAKPACPSNQYIVLKYSGLTNVVDYFGFRCNQKTGGIEVKMIIGKDVEVYQGFTGSSQKVYLPFGWTDNFNGISEFTNVDGGVTENARSDVIKIMNSGSWAGAMSITKGLLSADAQISYPTLEYNGFPGELIIPAGTTPPQTQQTAAQANAYILNLSEPYDRNKKMYVFLNSANTKVYFEYGLIKVDKYKPEIPDELVLLGTINTDAYPLITLSRANPVYPAGSTNNLVDARLYSELKGRRIIPTTGSILKESEMFGSPDPSLAIN